MDVKIVIKANNTTAHAFLKKLHERKAEIKREMKERGIPEKIKAKLEAK